MTSKARQDLGGGRGNRSPNDPYEPAQHSQVWVGPRPRGHRHPGSPDEKDALSMTYSQWFPTDAKQSPLKEKRLKYSAPRHPPKKKNSLEIKWWVCSSNHVCLPNFTFRGKGSACLVLEKNKTEKESQSIMLRKSEDRPFWTWATKWGVWNPDSLPTGLLLVTRHT